MKLSGPKIGQVQSMGRANLSAVGAVASAVSAKGSADKQVIDYLAKTGEQYLERKENAEHNKAKVDTMMSLQAIRKELDVKEFFTAEEAREVPKGAVRLTNADGSPRNNIPAYEVYPYLLDKRSREVVAQQSETITNPLLREEYLNLANGIVGKDNFQAVVKASQQQFTYLRQVAEDDSLQLAIDGKQDAAIAVVKEGDFSELEEKKLIRERKEVFEYEQDTRTLNMLDLPEINNRLKYMREQYGESEEDNLGVGKSSGKYNLEANIKRFTAASRALTGASNNANLLKLKEAIKGAGLGNQGDNNFLFKDGKQAEIINNTAGLTQNQRNTLLEDARIADVEGKALNATRLTPFSEDAAAIAANDKVMTLQDVGLTNEREGLNNAMVKATTEKEKLLKKDASTYLKINSPAVRILAQKVNDPELQKNPEQFAGTMRAYLHTMRAEQERIGLTPEEVNFLSEGEVKQFQAISDDIGRDPLGVTKLVGQMQLLQDRYTKEWPAVYGQLIKEGALKAEHVMGGMIKDSSMRSSYVRAVESKADREQTTFYKANIKQARADTTSALMELRGTLFTGGAQATVANGMMMTEQMTNLEGGITEMVMSELNATGTYDPQSVTRIANKLIDDNWVIHEGLRVPKGQGYDPDDVVNALRFMRSKNALSLPDDTVFFGAEVVGVSPEDNQINLRRQFISNATPSTNSDESGLVYKYASGNPVMIVKGGRLVPLTFTFDAIARFSRERVNNTKAKLRFE